ncbi:MAG: glycosyltransferase family 2 protein [Nitrososphaerales archaeon]
MNGKSLLALTLGSEIKNPEVSVIMALYNEERYVAQAIESVLNQTYANFELVIVDDKSKDRSLEIARGYEADGRVRILTNSENRGVAYTRNKGVKQSKGRLIAFVDSDDVYRKDKLELQIQEILREGSYKDEVVYTNYYKFNEEGEITTPKKLEPTRIDTRVTVSALIREVVDPMFATLLCLRETLLEVGLFDETLRIREDYEFMLRLARIRLFVGILEPLYGYRTVRSSMMHSAPMRESYRVKLRIIERQLQLNPELLSGADGAEIRRQIAKCLIAIRGYRSAFTYTLKDPRMLGDFYYCYRRHGNLSQRASST